MDLITSTLSITVILASAYLIVKFIIYPYLLTLFYRKQGIPMCFVPVIGSFNRDLNNTELKGDYYAHYNELAKLDPRPKAIGKNLGSRVQLYLIDPDAIQQFFINHEEYIKDPFLNAMTKILSKNGLVMAEGKIWRQHRKLISNGFQFDMLREVVPEVIQHSVELIDAQKHKSLKSVQIMEFCKATAGEVIGRIFFEESLGQYTMQGIPMTLFLADLLSKITSEPYNPAYLLFGMPLVNLKLVPRQKKLINDIREFREWCRGIIQRNISKREEDLKNGNYPYAKRKNMFDLLFDYQLSNPEEKLTEEDLIDEYITFFSDGVYTTGHFISMVTYYLECNPEWKSKVEEEMKQKYKSLDDITYDSLNELDVLNACMKETMRLAPPVVTAIERIALKDHILAGMKIKKNTVLVACHCANHLDPRFHDEPEKFDPTRWTQPSKTQDSIKQHPSVFVPFSLGARKCIGQNFAMNEAKIILIIFFFKFKYEMVDRSYKLKFTQRFLREPSDPVLYNLYPKSKEGF